MENGREECEANEVGGVQHHCIGAGEEKETRLKRKPPFAETKGLTLSFDRRLGGYQVMLTDLAPKSCARYFSRNGLSKSRTSSRETSLPIIEVTAAGGV